MKQLFNYHITPLLLALATPIFIYQIFFKERANNRIEEIIEIKGTQEKISSRHANFNEGDQSEIDLMASITQKGQLTLFGSSEFSDSPFVPYNFFPDSTGKPVIGIGHAYHQHLSILIELLASNDFNEKSEIVIFLSPGWFENGKSTNTSAFIEFARPNFLKKILHDDNIKDKYKKHIADYIYGNKSQFTGSNKTFTDYINMYSPKSESMFGGIDAYAKNKFNLDTIEKIVYLPELKNVSKKKWNGKMEEIAVNLKQDFLKKCTNNDLFVYDDYFKKYLLNEDGSVRSVTLTAPNISGNKELEDFKLLVQYIKERKMKASFVIIPFNPYYYTNTEVFNPMMNEITTTLDKNDIPTLNMYVDNASEYEPGILKDVMHLGDYGWMRVNQFIDSLYYQTNE